MKNKIVYSKNFLKEKNALTDDEQFHLDEVIRLLQYNRPSPGTNRELIKCKSGEAVFSLRVNQDVRLAAYLWKPKEYLLIGCGHHDVLYNRVKRCCLRQQKATELPIVEVDYELPAADSITIENTPIQEELTTSTPPPFTNTLANISDSGFAKLNISTTVITALKTATSDDAIMDEIQKIESAKVRDGLLNILVGEENIDNLIKTIENVIETPRKGVEVILEKNVADRENYFILNDELLELYMNGQLENWQVYLHADQTRGVEMEARGPMMVTGPAGTGKSIVAVHRVKWLLRNPFKVRGKVLFTTYTHTLAEYARSLLSTICTPEEMSRVEVIHFDAFLAKLLKQKLPRVKIYYESRRGENQNSYLNLFKKVYDECYHGTKDLRFVMAEYDRVIAEYNITTLEEYLEIVRPKDIGRLNSDARTQLWPIFETLNSYKKTMLLCPRSLAINMLIERVAPLDCAFDAIVVDEAQDFGAPEYRLFAKLTGNTYQNSVAYSLFFAGDGHQRIYNRSGSLKQCGINVTGRSVHLIKCYRSTKKIREYAEKIIADVQVKDMDEEIDSLSGCESLADGIAPEIKLGVDANNKYEIMASKINGWLQKGCQLGDCAVLVRKRSKAEAIVEGLFRLGIKATKIDRDNVDFDDCSIKVMTMHRAKGLQFINVIVDLDNWPQQDKKAEEDEVRTQMLAREKCILYMSIMRAMNDVLITNSYGVNRYIPLK